MLTRIIKIATAGTRYRVSACILSEVAEGLSLEQLVPVLVTIRAAHKGPTP